MQRWCELRARVRPRRAGFVNTGHGARRCQILVGAEDGPPSLDPTLRHCGCAQVSASHVLLERDAKCAWLCARVIARGCIVLSRCGGGAQAPSPRDTVMLSLDMSDAKVALAMQAYDLVRELPAALHPIQRRMA